MFKYYHFQYSAEGGGRTDSDCPVSEVANLTVFETSSGYPLSDLANLIEFGLS